MFIMSQFLVFCNEIAGGCTFTCSSLKTKNSIFLWKNDLFIKMIMRSTREKLTVCGLILSALAFLYFGLSTVWLQVQIKHLRLERNYLDHQIGAKKIELKALKSVSSNSRILTQNFKSNDSKIASPVSQVESNYYSPLDQIICF